jgi:hypothetical protein
MIQYGFKEPDNGIAVVRRFDLQWIYQSIGFAGGKHQERASTGNTSRRIMGRSPAGRE